MSKSATVDKILLTAASIVQTAAAWEPEIGATPQQGFYHHISWSTGVVSGVVEVECADDSSYAGTWAPMGTVTFSGTAPKQDYVFTPGRPRAIRHRISTVLVGGTVTTRLIGGL